MAASDTAAFLAGEDVVDALTATAAFCAAVAATCVADAAARSAAAILAALDVGDAFTAAAASITALAATRSAAAATIAADASSSSGVESWSLSATAGVTLAAGCGALAAAISAVTVMAGGAALATSVDD